MIVPDRDEPIAVDALLVESTTLVVDVWSTALTSTDVEALVVEVARRRALVVDQAALSARPEPVEIASRSRPERRAGPICASLPRAIAGAGACASPRPRPRCRSR